MKWIKRDGRSGFHGFHLVADDGEILGEIRRSTMDDSWIASIGYGWVKAYADEGAAKRALERKVLRT